MKREIKFRAWDAKYNAMDNHFWVGAKGVIYEVADRTFDTPNIEIEESKDNMIIMQYTGLKDCNGVEVYDGDIVESFVHPDIPLHHIIEWSDKYSGWFARNTTAKNEHDGSIQLFVYERNFKFTVIGNIHESPELLEDD